MLFLTLFFLFFSTAPLFSECVPAFSLMDAIAYTLENQLEVKISELDIDAQAGVVQNAAGPFDPVIDGFEQIETFDDIQWPYIGGGKTDCDGQEIIMQVNARKKTRLGTVFTFSAQVDQVEQPFLFPEETNIGTISFRVDQPLMRNFGYGIDTINEQASMLELYAVHLDTLQNLSQIVLNSAINYWEAVSAKHVIQISEGSEARIRELMDDLNELIKGDIIAKSDITQPKEQLAQQERFTLESKQNYYNTIQNLKFAIGAVDLNARDSDRLKLVQDFPAIQLNINKLRNMTGCWTHFATTYRYDIQASMTRVEEAELFVLGAYNQTFPELNAYARVLRQDFKRQGCCRNDNLLGSLDMNHPQTNLLLGVSFSVPLYNDAALGTFRQRKAQKGQAVFRLELLTQSVISELRKAISDQIYYAQELIKADEVVELNRKLIADESTKLKAGFSTIFVLLDFESRLTNSLLVKNNIKKNYMQNMARIRYLTSTIFQSDCCLRKIKLADLTTLPGIGCNGQ